jgi:hypothetical protein
MSERLYLSSEIHTTLTIELFGQHVEIPCTGIDKHAVGIVVVYDKEPKKSLATVVLQKEEQSDERI